MLPVFQFFFDRQLRGDVAKKNLNITEYYVLIFWICLGFFLPHKILLFFTRFFFLGVGGALLRNVNCKPHWGAMQMTRTKLEFIKFDTHPTCLVYFFIIIFSIDSSEARKKICWILSGKRSNNRFSTWQNAFARPRAGRFLWFKRMHSPFLICLCFFYHLRLQLYKRFCLCDCPSVFRLGGSRYCEILIANPIDGRPESNYFAVN